MNLTVRIHDIEYTKEVAQGVTFSEEYNETLDSGAIRLTHVKQIDNLRPYDDVYIYESAPEGYTGDWYEDNVTDWRSGGALHNGEEIKENGKRIPFYRHLLVDSYTESLINISEGIVGYSIELFSETKRLEMVQLPNICVTQPLKISKRHTIWWLLNKYVKLYSPKYKLETKSGWTYAKKYSLDPSLEKIFGDSYSQDFSLQNPTLRDVLSTLMVTKDMIPYVKDDVIYAKDIGHTTGSFDLEKEKTKGTINTIASQMASADYCDSVRRQYSNALSSEGICTFVEYLGFRNKDSSLMTLQNMRAEVGHPLMRVKKFKLCYYKKGIVYQNQNITQRGYFLVKHDITPLIKTREEYSLLSQDWRVFTDNTWSENAPLTMEDLAKYQLSTLYYSQGGTTIEGWGEKYSQLETSPNKLTSWNIEVTRIENILDWLDKYDIAGDISNVDYLEYVGASDQALIGMQSYSTMFDAQYDDPSIENQLTLPQKMKTMFFEIEYEGFYNGALIHSRDKGNDNIVQNDNSSVALMLLEKDGVSQKVKMNRFANKTYSISSRLDGDNYSIGNVLKLGSYCNIGNDNKVIVYHREYSIYDNYIVASYACIQDYVLKNFYTSVYAKYRINQLMLYSESVSRAENEKVILLLSKTKKHENESGTFFDIDTQEDDKGIRYLFSAFNPVDYAKNINKAIFIPYGEKNELGIYDGFIFKKILTDCYAFSSGNSLCFNIVMPDNISGGTFVDSWSSDYKKIIEAPSEDDDYTIGSIQKWNNIVDDSETGEIKKMLFKVSHIDNQELLFSSKNDEVKKIYTYSQQLPREIFLASHDRIKESFPMSIVKEIEKDNKERIDMTFQIEPISDTPDIVLSEYLVKLSDFLTNDINKKLVEDKLISKETTSVDSGEMRFFAKAGKKISNQDRIPKIEPYYGFGIRADDEILSKYLTYKDDGWPKKELKIIDGTFSFNVKWQNYYVDVVDSVTRLGTFVFSATSMYWDQYKQGAYTYTRLYLNGIGSLVFDDKEFEIKQIIFQDDDGKQETDSEGQGFYFVETDNETLNSEVLRPVSGSSTPWCTITSGGFFYISVFDINNGATPSILKQSVLHRNMFVEYSPTEIDSTIADKIIRITENDYKNEKLILPENFHEDKLPGDVFSVENILDENGNIIEELSPCILVDVDDQAEGIRNGTIKSINYWYLDFDSAYFKSYSSNEYLYEYAPTQSGYRFVFGVNVRPEDMRVVNGRLCIPIYISKVTNRDTRVFDNKGRHVADIRNVLDDDDHGISPVPETISEPMINEIEVGYGTTNISIFNPNVVYCDMEVDIAIESEGQSTQTYQMYTKDIAPNDMVFFEQSITPVMEGTITVETKCIWQKTESEIVSITKSFEVIPQKPIVDKFIVEPWIDPSTGTYGKNRWDVFATITNPNDYACYISGEIAIDEQGSVTRYDIGSTQLLAPKTSKNIMQSITAQGGRATISVKCGLDGHESGFATKVITFPEEFLAPRIDSFTVEDDNGDKWFYVGITNRNGYVCDAQIDFSADDGQQTWSYGKETIGAGKTVTIRQAGINPEYAGGELVVTVSFTMGGVTLSSTATYAEQ